MKKFEYINISLSEAVNKRYFAQLSGLNISDRMEKCTQLGVELMNELGAAGWELVLAEHSGRLIFKREIDN